LEEVVVTARKREETIQSIPETVAALSRETIDEAHITRPDDIGILVSNLNIVTRADNTPDVVLRGVGSFGVIQGVGFYVDDVQQFEGQTIRPQDVERIEVLKGPQGTLFGGANIGGAIKYVSRAPTSSLTAEGQVEVGNLNSRTYEGIVSGPVVGDSLNARLSLFNTSDDGFIYDPSLRRTLGEMNERGGRMTLEYDRTPLRVVFYLSGDILRGQSENLYFTPPNDHTYLRTVDDGTVPSFDRRLYSPTLKIEADFSRMALTSLTSYFHSHIDSLPIWIRDRCHSSISVRGLPRKCGVRSCGSRRTESRPCVGSSVPLRSRSRRTRRRLPMPDWPRSGRRLRGRLRPLLA